MSYAKLPGEYSLIDVLPEDLPAKLKQLQEAKYNGLNVTVPHKQAVLGLVDELTAEAIKVQAVNTISIAAGGKLIGHNTDLGGFSCALKQLLPERIPQRNTDVAMVLGAGGAARAAVWALIEIGFQSLVIVARRIEQAEGLIEQIWRQAPKLRGQVDICSRAIADQHLLPVLLVNCTPAFSESLGLEELIGNMFRQRSLAEQSAWFYDMVYLPSRAPTPLMNCIAQIAPNVHSQDGLQMLIEQAALAFAYWTGRPVPVEVMLKAIDIVAK